MPSATTPSPARTGPQGGPAAPARVEGRTRAAGRAQAMGLAQVADLAQLAGLMPATELKPAAGSAREAGSVRATELKPAAGLAAASTLLILLLLSIPAIAASAADEPPAAPAQAAVIAPPAGDAPQATAPAPAPEHDGGKVRLLAFGTEEMVLVRLPGGVFIWPETELTDGDKPRIILDFKGVEGWDEAYVPDGGGRIVKRIRTYLHKNEKRLRVVLDLAQSPKDYAVTLSYEERVYGTEITVSAIPLRHKQ